MSWDVHIMGYMPAPEPPEPAEDERMPSVMADGGRVRAVLAELLPGIAFEANGWGGWEGHGFSLGTSLRYADHDPVRGFNLFFRGDTEAASHLALAVADRLDALVFNSQTGGILTTASPNPPTEAWRVPPARILSPDVRTWRDPAEPEDEPKPGPEDEPEPEPEDAVPPGW